VKKQVAIWPVIGVAILILAAVAYMVVIRPKRAEASHLDEQIAEMQTKVAAARLASRPQKDDTAIKVADVFEVSKAMPDTDDMPGIILDLNSVAEATGIKFVSIQPSAPTPKTGYSAIGITLTFEGNYFDLTDFLFRLRNLVTVRDGRLASSGRLFTLDTLSMKEGKDGFPDINAGLTVSAYVYGAADAAASTLVPPTTTTEAPPPPPADASAGGVG
jgi:Tfp pilus assembly protein PilO